MMRTETATLVILAGGEGKRLAPVLDKPKVLLEFGGRTLAERTLDAFASAGVREAVFVTGWKGSLIEERLGDEHNGVNIRYVNNPYYKATGAGYGLLLARARWAGRPCVVMEGDQLLHPALVGKLMEGPDDCLLADTGKPELGEETVVVGRKGKVERLIWPATNARKNEAIVGEAIVMVKLSAESSRKLVGHLGMGEVIEPMNALDLRYLETGGLPWIEIDTLEDLERAEEIHRQIEEES